MRAYNEEQIHENNAAEWYAYESNKYLQDRLRHVVVKANWNKRVVSLMKKQNELSNNNLEIHRNNIQKLINSLRKIALHLKEIGMQYDENRINKIEQILIKIKNYDN